MLASEKDRGHYRNRNRRNAKKVFLRQDRRRDAASTLHPAVACFGNADLRQTLDTGWKPVPRT
jgi:hypothetical protein